LTKDQLQELFNQSYRTNSLQGTSAEAFEAHIRGVLGKKDISSEGYDEEELEHQRALTTTFHWGHNHDFGSFKLAGRTSDHYLTVMAQFMEHFPVTPDSLRGQKVMDVGCWTGGTTLLLAALGACVIAVEEAKKYADMTLFLAKSFGLFPNRVQVFDRSLYTLTGRRHRDTFDIAYFPGVLYHLSDPLLGLRILFNSLTDDGVLLLETAGISSERPLCEFGGSTFYTGTPNQSNWFIPSESALTRMLRETGFEDIRTVGLFKPGAERGRILGFARKVSHKPICRAGLSIPDIN